MCDWEEHPREDVHAGVPPSLLAGTVGYEYVTKGTVGVSIWYVFRGVRRVDGRVMWYCPHEHDRIVEARACAATYAHGNACHPENRE